MKRITAILLVLVLCLSLLACSEKSKDTYKVEFGKLSFEVPGDWIDTSDEVGPAYSDPSHATGVIILRYDYSDLPPKITQSDAIENKEDHIKLREKEISDVKEQKIKIDSTDAMRLDYNMKYSNGVETEEIYIVVISSDKYINNLTFYLEKGSEERNTIEKIINSIQL